MKKTDTLKLETKIRKLLKNRFHLHISYNADGTKSWSLYRKYENCDPIYYSGANKPIMTSDKNTMEDLYNFAKKHHKINLTKVLLPFWHIFIWLTLIFAILNTFLIHNRTISWLIIAFDIIEISQVLIIATIDFKNTDVDLLEMRENIFKFENLEK